jgi:DNA repair protein RadA/Sms
MAKEKVVYVCSNCGQESPKWLGRCPSCGEWNSFVEQTVRKEPSSLHPTSGISTEKSKPVSLKDIETKNDARIDMHDGELNRVLGGGMVPGSLVLIGGEPGIGKSTLVLQTVMKMPEKTYPLCVGRGERQSTEAPRQPSVGRRGRLPDTMRDILRGDIYPYQEYAA